jgi:hypothetical protein
MMEKRREVVRSLSIFNLNANKIPHLPENTSARIMFVYDKLNNIREYKILDSAMTEETGRQIRSWLEDNIEIDDVIHGLNSSNINADDFQKAVGN